MLRFARPDTQGQEIAKYCFLGPLGPWHSEKSRARADNRKTQFPCARGSEIEKKVTTLSGPPGAGHRKELVFRPFGLRAALGTERNSGPKTEKCNFPEPGALLAFRKIIRPPQKDSSKKCTTFLHFVFWPNGPPGGGKSQNMGFLGTFGLALGTYRNSGGTERNTNSLVETEKR